MFQHKGGKVKIVTNSHQFQVLQLALHMYQKLASLRSPHHQNPQKYHPSKETPVDMSRQQYKEKIHKKDHE